MKRAAYIPISGKQTYKVQMTHANRVTKQREDNMISSAFNIALLLSAWALRTQFDFGGKRISQFVDKVNDTLDSYNRGYLTINDINETLLEETGVEILDRKQLNKEL